MSQADTYLAAGDLRFRPIVEHDIGDLVRWLNDPEVGAWWHGNTETYDEAFVRGEFLEPAEPWLTRAIVERAGEPIGFQQWYSVDDEPETLEEFGLEPGLRAYGIDQFIGESRLHGQGIGTRQVRAVADWLVGPEGPGAGLVVTDPVVENLRAVRCYERAGFEKVRVLASHEQIDKVPRDSWLMVRPRAG